MAAKTGHKMKFYINTGTAAVPVWSLIADIEDLSIPDMSMGAAEFKRRSSNFTKNLPTIIGTIAVEFKLWHGVGDTNFDLLRAAFFAGTTYEFAILDGLVATSGTEGLRLPAFIEQFPWGQALEEVSGHDVRLVTAYHESPAGIEIDPSWMVVS